MMAKRLSNSEKFERVTKDIIKKSEGYDKIDPEIRSMFLSSLGVFLTTIQILQSEEVNSVDDDVFKLKVFEDITGINMVEIFKKRIDGDNSNNSYNTPVIENINNIDKDLLLEFQGELSDFLKV
jgi:hypothetical protein